MLAKILGPQMKPALRDTWLHFCEQGFNKYIKQHFGKGYYFNIPTQIDDKRYIVEVKIRVIDTSKGMINGTSTK